jgi:beta-glucanase (GH16 family)
MHHIGLLLLFFVGSLNAQTIFDDFQGNGNINSWIGDNCGLNTSFTNPYQEGINTSNTVLEYDDTGELYANVRFEVPTNLDLATTNAFSFKIYVPSSALSGSQSNQVSLKLQDGGLGEPWTTQTEIIKPIVLDEWQEVVFDFENDTYANFDAGSLPPIERTDFNRVVIQVNSENNNDLVVAYIDDVLHFDTGVDAPIFDVLVWSDEFDGSGAIDGTKWFHQTQIPGGGSWYNGEIQHYTDREVNSQMNGGFLNLVAKKELGYTDQGVTKDYTSARLNSKFAFTYGKVEVRAKLPFGVGTWPAIWMLGKNINEDGAYWDNQGFGNTGWPFCGEIDIMEHWGNNQNFVQSAMHTPSSFGNTFNKGGQVIPTASTEFHVYTVEWTSEKMVFKVDDVIHYTYDPEIKDSDTWPFDAEQYILFNVAVLPDIASGFTESSMDVDYIRIYQESALSVTEQTLDTNTVHIYPNPVKNLLHIEMSEVTRSSAVLQITDIRGRVVSKTSHSITDKEILYNVQSLNTGIYVAKIILEDGSSNAFKFIKR